MELLIFSVKQSGTAKSGLEFISHLRKLLVKFFMAILLHR